jgi:hypothetical protein
MRFPTKKLSKSDNWFWSRITDFFDQDADKPDEPSGDGRVRVVLKDAYDLITKVEAIHQNNLRSCRNLEK